MIISRIKKLSVFFVAIVVGSSACAPTTELSLRSSGTHKRSFTVEQPYQAAFQTVLDKARACFLYQPIDVQLTVVGNRVNRDRTGEVVVAEVYGATSREVFLMIDFEAVTDKETLVNAYAGSRKGMPYVMSIQSWLDNPKGTCVIDS